MTPDHLAVSIEAVRRFNRFYTRHMGVLGEGLLDSAFSLAEVRVIYELAQREKPTAAEIGADLGLDAGYLSRILAGFHQRRLIEKKPSAVDARHSLLGLTRRGREVFALLKARTVEQVRSALKPLASIDRQRLIGAMETIEKLLGAPVEAGAQQAPYLLRPHQVGDMGWVVHRQGVLYEQEYGYDESFEALAAEIVAKFIQHYDAKRERCWIAERDGVIVGSVFLVAASKTMAKLRLLYVEPAARGLGIGGRLVGECVRFARQAGYRKIILWTQSDLDAARHLYNRAGFRVTRKERHHSFSKDLVAETWELAL
jgi:DNA-binding MarR family transcriptional regulator/N-acetylglutamate synthase-like GNAT family acetyltransferase